MRRSEWFSCAVIDALQSFYGDDLNDKLDSFAYEMQSAPRVESVEDIVLGKSTYVLKWAQKKNDEVSLMPNECYWPLVPVFENQENIYFISLWREDEFFAGFPTVDRKNLCIPMSKKAIDANPILFDNDPGSRVDNATRGRDFYKDDMLEFFRNTWILEQGKPRKSLFFFEYDWNTILPKMEEFMENDEHRRFDEISREDRMAVWDEKLKWQKWDAIPLEDSFDRMNLEHVEPVCDFPNMHFIPRFFHACLLSRRNEICSRPQVSLTRSV